MVVSILDQFCLTDLTLIALKNYVLFVPQRLFVAVSLGCLSKSLYLCVPHCLPIPLAVRSQAWVCGQSLARIVGSNPIEGMDVCLS
jgi:hypothetical protein